MEWNEELFAVAAQQKVERPCREQRTGEDDAIAQLKGDGFSHLVEKRARVRDGPALRLARDAGGLLG